MEILARFPSLALVSVLLAGCVGDNTSSGQTGAVVSDTLGNKFNASCSGALCSLTPQDADLVPKSCGGGAGVDAFVLIPDPLLSIYAVLVSSSGSVQLSAAQPSRPVACASDADCLAPGISAGSLTYSYACTNGLCLCSNTACTSADGNLLTYDVLTLCQADIPWPTTCPYITSQPFAARIGDVADVCGSKDTCAVVPASCRQLTPPAAQPIDGGGSGVDAGF
jgi:hypothetical protein